jgi:hypothetical protein
MCKLIIKKDVQLHIYTQLRARSVILVCTNYNVNFTVLESTKN